MTSLNHYSAYLETSILHTIINNGYSALEQALLIIKTNHEHFYNENYRIVYQTIIEMYKDNKDINQLTVYEQVNRKITTKQLIKKIFDGISKGEIIDDLHEPCMRLVDYYIKRTMCVIGSQMQSNQNDTGLAMLANLSREVQNITTTYLPSNVVETSIIKDDALAIVRDAKTFRDKGEFPGVPTGFYKLDDITGGFKPGQLIILAARPAMGKTSFALSAALNASTKYPVVIFSLEMDKETLFLRLVSQYAKLSLSSILNGNVTEEQIEKIKDTMDIISKQHQIFIDDDYSLDSVMLRAKIRRYVNEHNVKIIFIDYLQLMKTDSKMQNREREIAKLSLELKQMAREYKIPIVILAQLNRDVEHRSDRIPMLADLRESGSIEQDADLVLFLYRPEYYDIQKYKNGDLTYNTCQVRIAKQRNGALENIVLTFVKEYTGFYNYIAAGILPYTNHQPYEDKYGDDTTITDDVPF